MVLTASRQLILLCFGILSGVVLGQKLALPTYVWLSVLLFWLIALSVIKNDRERLIATVAAGAAIGVSLWQLTGGRSWLHLEALTQAQSLLFTWRQVVIDRFMGALSEPHSSLITGILFGNRVALDRDLVEAFRTVGLSHIIAVSGYNLTVLTMNARTVFAPILGRNSFFVALALVTIFVLITGAPSSILRAAVMIIIILYARYIGRPSRSVAAIIFASTLLAVFEPEIVFDVGFQLSVAATYGLVRVAPVLDKYMRSLPLHRSLKQVIAETLSATIMTAPILIFYFERLSLVSPLTNILVVPIIPITMAVGAIGAVASIIAPLVGQYAMLLSYPLLDWIIKVAERFSTLDAASIDLRFSLPITVIVCCSLIAVCEYLAWRQKIIGLYDA